MTSRKACPVVLRKVAGVVQILSFFHPTAGKQLVKGSIEPGESPKTACERELWEEAGIKLRCRHFLKEWQWQEGEPVWMLYIMDDATPPSGLDLPDRWRHFCSDDGGHYFDFF